MTTTATLPPHLQLAALPGHMKTSRRQWVVAGADKIPLTPSTGHRASPTDPATWGSFMQAVSRASRDDLHMGWMLRRSEHAQGPGPIVVDIDHCINDAGELSPEAAAIVAQLNSYTEVSRSGRGLHILVEAILPPGRRRFPGGIEIYDRDRYIILTGDIRPGWGRADIMCRPETFSALYERLSAEAEPETPAAPLPSVPLSIDDEDVLRRARDAKNGGEFAALFDRGDVSLYDNDDSRADLALCSLLAFWTQDPGQIDQLFRRSALTRSKWERRADYRDSTIARALHRAAFYTPPVAPDIRVIPPNDQDAPSGADPCADVRDELAALRAENAALRAERDQLSRLQSATMTMFRSRDLHAGEKIIGLVSLFEAEAATTRGATDPEGWTDTPLDRIAESAGCSAKVAGKHQATISTTGLIESRTIDRRDPDTGVITKRRQIRVPAPTPDAATPSLPERIIALSTATPTRDPKKQRWGGLRVCPDCGDAGTVTTVTVSCTGCGQILSGTTSEQRPAPPIDHLDPSVGQESPMGHLALSTYVCGPEPPMGQVVLSGIPARAAADLAAREPAWMADAPAPWDDPPQAMLFPIDDASPSYHWAGD